MLPPAFVHSIPQPTGAPVGVWSQTIVLPLPSMPAAARWLLKALLIVCFDNYEKNMKSLREILDYWNRKTVKYLYSDRNPLIGNGLQIFSS